MGLGGSIFFLVLGAILVFAVRAEVGWIDLTAAGWIFMITGVAGIVLTSLFSRRRKNLHKEVHNSYQAERIARRQAIKRADAAWAEETKAYPDSYVASGSQGDKRSPSVPHGRSPQSREGAADARSGEQSDAAVHPNSGSSSDRSEIED